MSIVIEQDFEYTYDWPEGVPRDYDELVRSYGEFVARKVRHYNKVDRNFEDILQEVWTRIINAQLLEKFVESAAARLPLTMTAEEAVTYLGITWKQWENALRRGHMDANKWAPSPVEDQPLLGRQSVFRTEDIRVLDEIDPFRNRPNERRRPTVTARGFKAYLTQAIHNHFANWCRTRNRKYKESLLAPTSVVTSRPDSDSYHIGGEIEDFGSWEANLVAMTLGDEDMLSVKHEIEREFSRRGIPMESLLETEDYQTEDGRVLKRPTPEAQAKIDVLDYVAQGYTVREAFKAQERADARQRVKLAQQA